MQHYELLYIVPVKYEEKEVVNIQGKVKEFITKNKGTITEEGGLGILRLAYPIKQIYQGHYFLLEFDIEEGGLKGVDTELRMMAEVLRHQIVKKIAESEKELERALLREKKEKLEKQRQEQKVKEGAAAKEDETKRVSIEELDKKLDKILESDII